MARSCQESDEETSLDSTSCTGPAVASPVRHHGSCWRSSMSSTAVRVRESLLAGLECRDSGETSRSAGVPRQEQFGAVRQLLDDRVILHAGLSEVSVADIEGARRVFPVATVQNSYSLVDRDSEDVLAYCAANKIAFIPWFPLAAGQLTHSGGIVDRITNAHAATAGQISLAWLLHRSPASYRSLVRSGLAIWKRTCR